MGRESSHGRSGLLLLVTCAALGCGAAPSDVRHLGPDQVALEALRLARERPLDEAALEGCFAVERSGAQRVALLDVLEAFVADGPATLVAVEHAAGGLWAFVDAEIPLPGDGRARYSLGLVRQADEGFRVVWFTGPGVAWPPRPASRSGSLSVSAHPAGSGER